MSHDNTECETGDDQGAATLYDVDADDGGEDKDSIDEYNIALITNNTLFWTALMLGESEDW